MSGYIGPIIIQPSPAAPATMSIDVNVGNHELVLLWNKNTESYFDHYIIQRADSLEQLSWNGRHRSLTAFTRWKTLAEDLNNEAFDDNINYVKYKDTGLELYNKRGMSYKYRVSSVSVSHASSSYTEYPYQIKLGARAYVPIPSSPIIRRRGTINRMDAIPEHSGIKLPLGGDIRIGPVIDDNL